MFSHFCYELFYCWLLGKGTTGTAFDLSLTEGRFGRDLHYKTRNVAVFAENLIRVIERLSLTQGMRYETGCN